jgi:hypothetical protein
VKSAAVDEAQQRAVLIQKAAAVYTDEGQREVSSTTSIFFAAVLA